MIVDLLFAFLPVARFPFCIFFKKEGVVGGNINPMMIHFTTRIRCFFFLSKIMKFANWFLKKIIETISACYAIIHTILWCSNECETVDMKKVISCMYVLAIIWNSLWAFLFIQCCAGYDSTITALLFLQSRRSAYNSNAARSLSRISTNPIFYVKSAKKWYINLIRHTSIFLDLFMSKSKQISFLIETNFLLVFFEFFIFQNWQNNKSHIFLMINKD